MSTQLAATGPRPRVSDEEILRATRRCIDRSGHDKFTMAEVAAEAGLTRVQIYNRFGSRNDLLLALLVAHAQAFNVHQANVLGDAPSVAQAIVDGMLAAIKAAQSDRYFGLLVLPATGEGGAEGAPEAALALSRDLWVPVIERGLASGELASDLSPADIARWIGLTELNLFSATRTFGLSLAECEQYVRAFVVAPLSAKEPRP